MYRNLKTNLLGLTIVALIMAASPSTSWAAGCCRRVCVVYEDAEKVAAREAARQKTERFKLIGGGVTFGILGLTSIVNFIRETRNAIQAMNRPKEPWEIVP